MNHDQLRDDLNKQAERRRQDYMRLFAVPDLETRLAVESIKLEHLPGDMEFKGDWSPHWKPSRTITTLLAILFAFAAGLGYEVIRHAYSWLYSLFS